MRRNIPALLLNLMGNSLDHFSGKWCFSAYLGKKLGILTIENQKIRSLSINIPSGQRKYGFYRDLSTYCLIEPVRQPGCLTLRLFKRFRFFPGWKVQGLSVISYSGIFLTIASVRFSPSLGLDSENSIPSYDNMIDIEAVYLKIVIYAESIKHELIQFLPDRPFTIKP